MQKKEMAGLMVIAAGCLWGVIGLFSRKLSAVGFDAVQITALRSLVTAAGLFLLLFCKDRKLCRIDWKDLWMFLGTGICSIAGFNIFYFVTISITTLSVAAILLYTAPFFVMVLSAVLFHEKITAQKVKGLVFALAGCICTTGIFSGSIHVTVLGILTGVASGFCYALYSIFGKFALKKYTSETVTLYTFLMASAAMLPLSHPADMFSLAVSDFSLTGGIILLGLVCTLLPFLLYTRGLSRMDSGKASVLAFAEPLTATLMGVVAFGEVPDGFGWLGVILLFGALVLLQMPQKQEKLERFPIFCKILIPISLGKKTVTAIFGTTVFFSCLKHKHDRRGNGYGRKEAAIFVMGMLYDYLPLCAPSGTGGGNHAACGRKDHCAGCGARRLGPGKNRENRCG